MLSTGEECQFQAVMLERNTSDFTCGCKSEPGVFLKDWFNSLHLT